MKRQYLAEINGQTPQGKKALTPEQQKIQSLEKQLWRAKRDNEILKKANPDYTVHELCRVFQTSISTYNYQCRQKPIKHEELVMMATIKTIATETGHAYGKRHMHASLLKRGYKLGIYRTATLMKKSESGGHHTEEATLITPISVKRTSGLELPGLCV